MSKTNGNYNNNPNIVNTTTEREIQNIASDFDPFANVDGRFHQAMITWISNGFSFNIKNTIDAGDPIWYTHDKSLFSNDIVTTQDIIDLTGVSHPMHLAIAATIADQPLLESNLNLINDLIESQEGTVGYFTFVDQS